MVNAHRVDWDCMMGFIVLYPKFYLFVSLFKNVSQSIAGLDSIFKEPRITNKFIHNKNLSTSIN